MSVLREGLVDFLLMEPGLPAVIKRLYKLVVILISLSLRILISVTRESIGRGRGRGGEGFLKNN